MTSVDRPGYGRYSTPPSEPTPWAAGITVVVMVAALTTVGVYAFGAALIQVHPLFSLAVNSIAVIGIAPTAWRRRTSPVTRWVLAGVGAGVLLGWTGLLFGV